MLFLLEKRINIGISQHATENTRHGVLWVVMDKDGNKVNTRVPIIIDKPQLIAEEGLNYATWRRVKKQIDKMGIKATHIEFDFTKGKYEKGGTFCYDLLVYKELYCSGKKGMPLFTNGCT